MPLALNKSTVSTQTIHFTITYCQIFEMVLPFIISFFQILLPLLTIREERQPTSAVNAFTCVSPCIFYIFTTKWNPSSMFFPSLLLPPLCTQVESKVTMPTY